MPLLDVSRILSNPLFADTFDLYRNSQTVGSNGIAVDTSSPTQTGISGVVTANRGRSLQRMAEGSKQTDAITVHTTYRLTTGAGSTEADQIVWNGARYVVVNVADYSRFGAGFICATCDLLDFNP